MQKITLIGNIGNDAAVKSSGNNQFVTFNVAVTTRRKNGDVTHENTNWYDCSFDNVKLAEHLKKGTKVYIEGGFKLDMFMSEKQNKWIPKVNVFVNQIELLSAKKDDSEMTPQGHLGQPIEKRASTNQGSQQSQNDGGDDLPF